MTPLEQSALEAHQERAAILEFARLMMRIGVLLHARAPAQSPAPEAGRP